jgi:choline dehydrogenase
MELTTRDGRRASTAGAYLASAMKRPNLTIVSLALVLRVLLERGRAIGVEYARGRELITAYVDREVLLSGGTFNSPQMLMLSGIGPADELSAVGIAPVHDLPGVGKNLSEHPNARNLFKAKYDETFLKYLRLDRAGKAALQWFMFKTGPFVNNGSSANIFFRSRPDLDRPDLQLICVSINPDAKLWLPGLTAAPVHRFAARGGVLHPKSRGWVKLRSADPADPPRILFNMLGETEDLDAMIHMIRVSRDIYSRSPLAEHIECELFPGPEVTSDEALGEAIRASATHRSHPVGTCAMGNDVNAVVDAQLRVHGLEGLRVIDASIMPDEPTGNTNIPTIMIGEVAADMIRGRRLPRADLSPSSGYDVRLSNGSLY